MSNSVVSIIAGLIVGVMLAVIITQVYITIGWVPAVLIFAVVGLIGVKRE